MTGFDFSNHTRNAALHAQGVPLPKATSTGTTIVGCLFEGGVVIAADTRATSGPIVADKVRAIEDSKTHHANPIQLELRETPLHLSPNLVRRGRYCCRH